MRTIFVTGTFTAFFILACSAGYTQCHEGHLPGEPALRASAKKNKLSYDSAIQTGSLKKALPAIQWLLTYTPSAYAGLYEDAINLYTKLAAQEKDGKQKRIYVDSLFICYNLQLKNCGTSHTLLSEKAIAYFTYKASSYPDSALSHFNTAFKANGDRVTTAALIPYMQTVKLNDAKFKTLTDAEIIHYYDRIIQIAETKIRDAHQLQKPVDTLMRIKDDVDALLISMVVIDCNFVRKNLGPRFRKNPDDLALARKIISFMWQGLCYDDPLWVEAGERVYYSRPEKEYALAKSLGMKYFEMGNYAKAQQFFKDATASAPADQEKTEMLIFQGRSLSKQDKTAARSLFLKALEIDKNSKQAFEGIGDLYYNSFEDCGKMNNPVEDKLPYFLAAEYYQRSGNDKKVALARGAFPTKKELSQTNYKSGDHKYVGCWIHESTVIRTKD